MWQYASGFVAPNGFREYCFSAVAGTAYEFATCNRADFDTVVEVRDATGRSVLAYNDDYCARQSDLAWRAPSSGTYRVRVRGYGSSSGSFTLAY